MGNDDVAGPKADTGCGFTSTNDAAEAPPPPRGREEEEVVGEFAATATQEVDFTSPSEACCFVTVFAASGAAEIKQEALSSCFFRKERVSWVAPWWHGKEGCFFLLPLGRATKGLTVSPRTACPLVLLMDWRPEREGLQSLAKSSASGRVVGFWWNTRPPFFEEDRFLREKSPSIVRCPSLGDAMSSVGMHASGVGLLIVGEDMMDRDGMNENGRVGQSIRPTAKAQSQENPGFSARLAAIFLKGISPPPIDPGWVFLAPILR